MKYISLILISIAFAGISGCAAEKGPVPEAGPAKQQEEAAEESGNTQGGPLIEIADFEEEFQALSGCAVLFDTASNTYTYYREEAVKERVSPYSTFKIVSSLAGLHTQAVTSEDSKLGYDGTVYPVEAWNQDLGFKAAFQNSCVWYFRKLIDVVGQEEMRNEVKLLNYGNCDLSEWMGNGENPAPELNGFWLGSSLKISPLEQVDVIRRIMEGETIYSQEEIGVLKDLMLMDSGSQEKVYGKTGSGNNTGWFVGFAENREHRRYFAVYLDESNTEKVDGAAAKEIAYKLLDIRRGES